ncbi:hypothetical protein DSBG_1878 [Desulfosporosinus sp. BG]|nr:hypothetical protein DSBG_1878 [Desulfosporosinus sp. BG]
MLLSAKKLPLGLRSTGVWNDLGRKFITISKMCIEEGLIKRVWLIFAKPF